MKFSSTPLSDITKAKGACLSTIAISCVVIGIRVLKRGYL